MERAYPSRALYLVCFALLLISGVSAADYYVSLDGSDANPGTVVSPWRTIGFGVSQIENGDTLYIRGGEYRLVDEGSTKIAGHSGATADSHVTIAGYPGERAMLLGSRGTEGMTWEQYDENVWRISGSFLTHNPTAMYRYRAGHVDSERVPHSSHYDARRRHHNVSEMIENMWTMADASGTGCDNGAYASCYVYYWPPSGENPNNERFELPQRNIFYAVGADYLTFTNLEMYYTQSAPIFTEGCDNMEISYSIFGHNSNSVDNSYGLRIWSSGGAHVHHNKVFDSKYWGGTPNSKGITFMVADPDNPHIVEYNEVYDIPGHAAIGVKNGVSGLIARYNYIHDSYLGFEPGGARCVWSSTNTDGCQSTDVEYRPGGGWQIYGNILENVTIGVSLPGSQNDNHNNRVINNIFLNGETGINFGWDGSFGNEFTNNIFMGNEVGIYLRSGGTTTTVEDYLDQFTAHNNIYYGNAHADIHLRPNWGGGYYTGKPYTIEEFKASFSGRETGSLGANPLFVDAAGGDYHLQSGSPALDAGDGAFFGLSTVDIGAYPTGEETIPEPNPPDPCECTVWVDTVCGGGSCTATELQQTRSCTPAACDIEAQCVSSTSCEEPVPPPSTCSSPELAGDANRDGVVNLNDLTLVASNFGLSSFDAHADLNCDNAVGLSDLVIVASNFGTTTPTPPPSSLPAPDIAVRQVPDTLQVGVIGFCPDNTWCQLRRTGPGSHIMVKDGATSGVEYFDDSVQAGVTYTYNARYFTDGQESEHSEKSVSVVAPSVPEPTITPVAPSLDAASLDGDMYVLSWSLDGNGAPEGGYDVFIDGVDTNEQHRTQALTQSLPGLDTTVRHCFRIQARWIQEDPDVFKESNERCVDPVDEPAPPPNDPPSTTGYVPFMTASFDGGTVGAQAVGSDALNKAAARSVFSDVQTLDGSGLSCENSILVGKNYFGGEYRLEGEVVGAGDDIWMRQGLYFPGDACWGCGDTPGDCWGAVKWMRMEFGRNDGTWVGPRLTLQLGGVGKSCNGNPYIWGASREYDGNANLRAPTQVVLPRDQWNFIQWQVHLGDENTGFIRFWLNDQYLGQVDGRTMPTLGKPLAFIKYGDYWNGGPYQDVTWYMDDVIMTTETPDTVDAGGRPYIAPSARANDW